MTIPFNRFVAFAKPYINLLAGALAAWLVAKLNVLGIPGLGEHENELATGLTAAGVWALTQGAAQLGDLRWLKGHHIEIIAQAKVDAAAATQTPSTGTVVVSDEEEFASPPPESSETPDPPA